MDGWEQDELEGNWSYAAYKAECIKGQGADRCLVLGRPCGGLRSDLMYLDSGLGVVAAWAALPAVWYLRLESVWWVGYSLEW